MLGIEKEDYDLLLLQLKRSIGKKESSGQSKVEKAFGWGFSVKIPGSFQTAEEDQAEKIFWTKDRPPIVFLTENKRAGITFQILSDQTEKTLSQWRRRLQGLLEGMDGRTVFYESGVIGQEISGLWLEYKSFVGREGVYNLWFLFTAKKKDILGTFFCPFAEYDQWKEEILELFDTLKKEGGEDERV